MRKLLAAGGLCLLAVVAMPAQEKEDRTLLPTEQMLAIINEASGERAMHHVLELVPYQRVRLPEEYKGHFRESEVMARLAKEYGFSNVTIESFAEGEAWQPTAGELWLTSPRSQKVYDVHDMALSLASLNANMDATGDLVDVGLGREQDYAGKDVTGKFVLMSIVPNGVGGSLGAGYAQAIAHGALGVIGVNAIGFQRANDFPDQIVSTSVTATKEGTAAWNVSPKTARELASMLLRGDKVTIRSVVKSEKVPTRSEIVHAEIPGDGSTTQGVAIGGHLYEGVIKQGANDDNSGCALTLEIGRTYLKLIKDGKLPRPKRTINFQWLAEISGTNAWLNAHPDKAARLIGDLNFDMEGIRVADSRSYWIMQRTPDTFPSYINDVGQSMMEYVSDLTRERVRYRGNGYAPSLDITSPTGSRDAFYIKIDKHYGSSDHVTYMQHGIPAVMFITWPDMWYHSSGDTPDKQDPTQYKRAAVVGTGALAVIASGGDPIAARVTTENLGRGTERMGDSERKGVGYLADAASPADLHGAWKEARIAIRHQAEVEKRVIRSSSVLYVDPAGAEKRLQALEAAIDRKAVALVDEARAAYGFHSARMSTQPITDPAPTAEERAAAAVVVECTGRATWSGCAAAGGAGGGGRGQGGGGRGQGGGGRGQAGPSLPGHMNAELTILLGKKLTPLEIRDFLSGEFEPVPLADVMAVLKAREAAGLIKLVPKPTSPAPSRVAAVARE